MPKCKRVVGYSTLRTQPSVEIQHQAINYLLKLHRHSKKRLLPQAILRIFDFGTSFPVRLTAAKQ